MLHPLPLPVFSLLLILPLVIFWAWMFRAMMTNDELPETAKNYWTLACVILNVFAAAIYYVQEYRNTR